MEIILNREDIHKGSLILINRYYPLVGDENTKSFIPVTMERPDILLDAKAASVLSRLMEDIGCKNDILPVSGFRSLSEQQDIYSQSLETNGKAFTEQYVALPNHSEHQTGLAIDLAKKEDEIDFIRPNFPYEGICNKFRILAADYGLIERYQQGKEKITGIAHEPWHFRYVGYPHSKIMQDEGLSLEEYIDYLRSYTYARKHLTICHQDQVIEIFHVDLSSSIRTRMTIPDHLLYQISGNNVDGVIVTLWRNRNE